MRSYLVLRLWTICEQLSALCLGKKNFTEETEQCRLFKTGKNFGFKNMKITKKKLRELIIEELSADDKAEIKKIASKEAETLLKSKTMKDLVAKEVEKSLNSTASKEQIGDITKKVLKKLYKDLSLQHPYIIDRIKV